jgi:UDP-N-acetyl-2-amino-2-deoxyglucuronate dehydrogenase
MNTTFAIIGCGRIAERHAGHMTRYGNLLAVCDIVPEKANAMAARYQAKPYYSVEDMLASETGLQLVSICTPNGLHAIHAIKVLEAGIHVLCEKPLCIQVEDGLKMINAAKNTHKKLFVVKQNRYNPPVVFLKELILSKKLGAIYSFQLNCFWNRPPGYFTGWRGTKELDGGTLYTQFSHFIDLLYWILGDIAKVTATRKNFAHPGIAFEDAGIAIIEMENGAIGTLNYSVNSFEKNMEGSFTVLAENGTVKIGGQYLNELEYCRVKGTPQPELPEGNPANAYGFYTGSMSNHDKVYENLMLALQDDTHEFASAEEGLKTVEIIQKIYGQ